MSRNNTHMNLRRAVRWECDRIPVNWERESKTHRRSGWMFDISAIGLGYLTSQSGAPNRGDFIQVTPRRSSDTIACRVVRVDRYHEGLCLVGCERIDMAESAVRPTPKPKRDRARIRHRPRRYVAAAA